MFTSPHSGPRMKIAATQVGAATIIVAVAGYAAQFFAARSLGPANYTVFAVFWALLYMLVGALSGAAQEVIRVSRLSKIERDSQPDSKQNAAHPRIGFVAITTGVSIGFTIFLTGFVWGPGAFGSDWLLQVFLLSLAVVLVSGSVAVNGMLAGLARWRLYSTLAMLEGVARLFFFVIAALFLPNVLGFSLASVLSFVPGLLVGFLWGPLRRDSLAIRSDSLARLSSTRILRSVAAAGLSSVLVVGWPAILSAASVLNPRGSTAVSLGVLILLLSLTRAPLMVPLTSFQNALVARFTGLDPTDRRRWVASGIGIIAVGSCLLAALAALLGPVLLPLIFGNGYQASAAIIAALTAAAAGLGIITLTSVAAITSGRHSSYLLGWMVALAVALAVLFLLPVPFEWATVLALILGPLVGASVQLTAPRRPDH